MAGNKASRSTDLLLAIEGVEQSSADLHHFGEWDSSLASRPFVRVALEAPFASGAGSMKT
jgi:hypothetical protein